MLVAFASSSAFAQQGKPTITGVANVASYASGAISPGEMLVIFGTAMGPSELKELELDGQGRVASTLLGRTGAVRWSRRPVGLRF